MKQGCVTFLKINYVFRCKYLWGGGYANTVAFDYRREGKTSDPWLPSLSLKRDFQQRPLLCLVLALVAAGRPPLPVGACGKGDFRLACWVQVETMPFSGSQGLDKDQANGKKQWPPYRRSWLRLPSLGLKKLLPPSGRRLNRQVE